MSNRGRALSVLIVSTLAFTMCFMVWMMFGVIGIRIQKTLNLNTEVGVLPRLVHSRFALHAVEVLAREPGNAQSFDAVRGAVAMSLRQLAYVTARRQYLRLLAGAAEVRGVDLDAADTSLVQ